MAPKKTPLAQRFRCYIDKNSAAPCWIWTGGRDKDGYGRFFVDIKLRTKNAHRVAWLIAHGTWPPDGLCVLHTCDNPACVRIDHLYLGNAQQNMDDMVRRGRQGRRGYGCYARGSACRSTILTPQQVRRIRKRHKDATTCAALARQYNVHEATIRDIVKKRSWKWVT